MSSSVSYILLKQQNFTDYNFFLIFKWWLTLLLVSWRHIELNSMAPRICPALTSTWTRKRSGLEGSRASDRHGRSDRCMMGWSYRGGIVLQRTRTIIIRRISSRIWTFRFGRASLTVRRNVSRHNESSAIEGSRPLS